MEMRIISILTTVFITSGLFALFVAVKQDKQNSPGQSPTPTFTTEKPYITTEKPQNTSVTPTLAVDAPFDWNISIAKVNVFLSLPFNCPS